MQEAIRVLNQLVAEGVIADYAIGGGMATLFYTEPFLTEDVDVFVVLPDMQRLDLFDNLFRRLQELGYQSEGMYVAVGGTALQFLVPPSDLESEALETARRLKYGTESVKVFRPEYLMAIYLRVAGQRIC
jgi:hypothetical protein